MKNIVKVISLVLVFSSFSLAQTSYIRNDGANSTPSTANIIGNGDKQISLGSVDSQGKIFINAGAGATSLGKTVATAAASSTYGTGDVGVPAVALIQNSLAQGSGESDGRYGVLKRNVSGGLFVAGSQVEDAVAGSGDAGVFTLGVANESATALAANGDYIAQSLTTAGQALGIPMYNSNVLDARQLGKLEDAVAGNGDAIVAVGGVQRAGDNNTAADGDYSPITLGMRGEQITSLASANAMFHSCGTATGVTSDVEIVAAIAGQRHYVTSITCSNSSATVATNLNFKDGATTRAVGGVSQMATTSNGSFAISSSLPLIRGTVNTAINFNTAVAVTSTVCCAAGYTSAN